MASVVPARERHCLHKHIGHRHIQVVLLIFLDFFDFEVIFEEVVHVDHALIHKAISLGPLNLALLKATLLAVDAIV